MLFPAVQNCRCRGEAVQPSGVWFVRGGVGDCWGSYQGRQPAQEEAGVRQAAQQVGGQHSVKGAALGGQVAGVALGEHKEVSAGPKGCASWAGGDVCAEHSVSASNA